MADVFFLAGDRYHCADEAFAGVGPVLESAGLNVEYTTNIGRLNWDNLKDKRLLIIFRDGMEWPHGESESYEVWMQAHQEKAIEKFVRQGGSFMPLHNSGWAYPWKGLYRKVLGGYYQGHPPVEPFDVRVVDSDHPITKGVHDFEIVDEQHFLWFDYERVNLLLKSIGRDGRESAAGWAYKYKQGRVVYLANGHTLEILQHKMVHLLLSNAVQWLLR